jgi:hypothetical protein
MAKFNETKYMTKRLTNLYAAVNEISPNASEKYSEAVEMIGDTHKAVIAHAIKKMAEKVSSKPFNELEYSEDPSMYGSHYEEFRGVKLTNDFFREFGEAAEVFELYFDSLGMGDYWRELAMKDLILNLPQIAEDFDITVLCDHNDKVIKLPESEIDYGNEKIMSEEDWDKFNEIEVSEYSDLVCYCNYAYATDSVMSIISGIDEGLNFWIGDDGEFDDYCVLGRLQTLVNDEDSRLYAVMAAKEINDCWKLTRRSVKDRCERMRVVLDRYEEMANA